MADPFTLTAMAVIGTGTSILGGITQANAIGAQGEADAQRYQYLAGVADINREIALQNADYERMVGIVEATDTGLKHGQAIGRTTAAQGASNLDVNFGSNVQVRESMQAVAKHDQDVVRSNAARRAYGHEVEAFTQSQQGQLYRASGQNSRAAARYGQTASYLGTATSVANRWASFGMGGGFGGSGSSLGPINMFGGAGSNFPVPTY